MTKNIAALLVSKLGASKVLSGADVADRFHHIWETDKPIQAKAVVLPSCTEDVVAVMKICNENQQPVVVHGGLTNLVGSTETTHDEVVISMEKLNQIEEIDPASRTMTVQAGVILERIQVLAKDNGLLLPLNYGAKGSAQIGGAISTNAGGLQVFRFGMTRNLVLGLEVVMADGTIISSLKKIIKDNSGYDLKQLFIGSEGTLGIVTKAVLKLSEYPTSRNSAYVGLDNYESAIAFLKFIDRGMGGQLSGFELMWADTYKKLSEPDNVKAPLPFDYKFYVLIETLGSNQEIDQGLLEDLLQEALENEMILDAAMAQRPSDHANFWEIRENVDSIIGSGPFYQAYDISIPIPDIGPCAEKMMEQMRLIPEVIHAYAFGHIADGNLHFLILKTTDNQEVKLKLDEIAYSPLKALGGSVSAEHGIGSHKKAYLSMSRSPEEIALMRTLKNAMDPRGLLNRGKVL